MNIVHKVFTAIDSQDFITDICDIKNLPTKVVQHSNSQAPNSANNVPRQTYKTILVSLRSPIVREHLLRRKRTKKRLLVSEVFDSPHQGLIYVNDHLPADIYNLRKRAKARVSEMGWKSCYTQDGHVYVRKSYGSPPLMISSEDDLAHIS